MNWQIRTVMAGVLAAIGLYVTFNPVSITTLVAGIIPWWMIIIIAARDAWMMLLVLWLAQYDYGPLPVHFVGKAGTFMLMVSIVALIFCDIWENPFVGLLHLAALAAGIWGVGLYWLAGCIYSKQGISLLVKEKRADGR